MKLKTPEIYPKTHKQVVKLTRLGSVSFLNAKPLTFPIEKGLVKHDFDIVLTPPAELSVMLHRKEIDLGLIPVAEFIRRGTYSAVPDISISSNGRVDSVILLTGGKLADIKTVAVDRRSQSSTALLKIVLEIFHKISPSYIPREPDGAFMTDVDAGMLIGDTGLDTAYNPPKGYDVYDLGEIWTNETGLPFVYAVFAVNEGVTLGQNLDALVKSKACGTGMIGEIAERESERLGLDENICSVYLRERIKYDLGEKEIEGIIRYSELLSELGLCEKIPGVSIYTR